MSRYFVLAFLLKVTGLQGNLICRVSTIEINTEHAPRWKRRMEHAPAR